MVKLYTTGCPKCNVLEKKLNTKGINFEKITDVDLMLAKGYSAAPVLEVNDKPLSFTEAVAWVNNY